MISVVIPTLIRDCHQYEMTLKCIELAKANTKVPFELVIVETETNHLSRFADIHIYEKARSTSGKSINRGFRCASGDMIALLTNDVMVDEGWLEHLIECFQTKADCGLSTLATDQLNHEKKDEIKEGIWFGVAMIPKEDAWFDENFVGSWDDTDMIMRSYLRGRKMYRNYKSVVHHKPGQTLYSDPKHEEQFIRNRELFIKKYIQFQSSWAFQVLVGGIIL